MQGNIGDRAAHRLVGQRATGWGLIGVAAMIQSKPLVGHAWWEVQLREVDLVEHPEVAVKYGVLSTPALAINGELAWVGTPSAHELRRRIEASLHDNE